MFLLLAAGAARAEDPSGDKGLTTYAIATVSYTHLTLPTILRV